MKLRFGSSRGLSSILLGAACAFTFAASLAVPVTVDAADRFGNIATRGKVLSGPGNEMIAGFIIEGDTTKCSVVRARGPSMGISGVLADPVLEVKRRTLQPDGSRKWETIGINDDWQDQEHPEDVAIIEDLGKAPGDAKEAAIFGCFEPNTPYTAIIKGAGSTTGIALAEVLDADSLEELEVVNGDLGAMQAQIDDLTALVDSLQSQINGLAAVATTGKYSDLSGKPNLATVATTGSYNDLTDVPSGGGGGSYSDADAIAAVRTILHPVAESGNYNHLNSRPSLKPVATSGKYSDLTGKPALATVATTGSYYDLVDEPSGGGGGDSHPALAYMTVSNGELIVEGIDLRVQNGNLVVGEGGVGTGVHNLIVGHDNVWDGDYGIIVGHNNDSVKNYTFMQGSYHTITGSADYSGAYGGRAHYIFSNYSVVVGGSGAQLGNFGYGAIFGGKDRIGFDSGAYGIMADG